MPQDRETGAAGNAFGHETAPRIAQALGATRLSKSSNEFALQGRRLVIKCARVNTSSVGVTYKMLDRIEAVLGAFEEQDGRFGIYEISAAEFRERMRPSQSKGPSEGKVGLVARKDFHQHGKLVSRVALPDQGVGPDGGQPCL
jgi:hypothetical protein